MVTVFVMLCMDTKETVRDVVLLSCGVVLLLNTNSVKD